MDGFSTLSITLLLRPPHISVQARERTLRKTFEPTDHPLTATTIVM